MPDLSVSRIEEINSVYPNTRTSFYHAHLETLLYNAIKGQSHEMSPRFSLSLSFLYLRFMCYIIHPFLT